MSRLFNILYILIIICTITSCRSTKNSIASVDTMYITKTEYQLQSRIDSIYIDRYRDRYIAGDTVYVNDTKIEYRYRYRTDTINATDTVYISKVDLKEKVVEKNKYPLLPWEIVFALAMILVIAIRIKERSTTAN